MKLPRDVSGDRLVRLLRPYGYVVTRQVGSHLRLTTPEAGGHNLTIPLHRELRPKTLAGILQEVAAHFGIDRDVLAARLLG